MTSSTFTTVRRSIVAAGIALSVLVSLAPAAAAAPVAAPASAAALDTPAVATAAVAPTAVPVRLAAAAPPAGFKLYTGRNWSWFGPAGYHAVYGTYGITQISGGGGAVRDYGFSSTLCSAGSTWTKSATANFAARRAAMKAGSGAVAWKWLSIGAVTHLGGLQFRQAMTFDATMRNGQVIRAKVIFMYAPNSGQYCYQSSDSRSVVRSKYAANIAKLDAIAKYTTYRGPGACDPSPQHVC